MEQISALATSKTLGSKTGLLSGDFMRSNKYSKLAEYYLVSPLFVFQFYIFIPINRALLRIMSKIST